MCTHLVRYLPGWTDWLHIHHSERSMRQFRKYNLDDLTWPDERPWPNFPQETPLAWEQLSNHFLKKWQDFRVLKTSFVQHVSVHCSSISVLIWKTTINLIQGKSHFPFYSNDSNSWNHNNPLISIRGPRISITGWKRESDFCPEWDQL